MKHVRATILLSAVLAASAFGATRAFGQASKETSADSRTFNVQPAKQPDPALRYTLLPRVYEQIPGSAAPLYFNAMFNISEKITIDGKERDFRDVLDEYQNMPLKKLKESDASRNLNGGALTLLEQGSLRDRARPGWETSIRQQGFATLLPYLNHIRMAAQFVAVDSRVHLADGDIDGSGADRRASILFAMTHHLREDPLLVQMLVGIAATEMGLKNTIEPIMQTPGGPNLYWALASLPHPYYSVGESIEWERAGAYWSIATLRGRRPEDLSGDEWAIAVRDLAQIASNSSGPDARLEVTAMAIVFYPRAKQSLIDSGTPADQVSAMPVAKVIGLSILNAYNHWLDEMGKSANAPYWQGFVTLQQAEQDLGNARSQDSFNVAYALVPAMSRAYAAAALDRHIAALQTIEAIRAYAADHDGKLPPALADIQATPAPLDPTTGKLFDYRVTGDHAAEISSPALPGSQKPDPMTYVITIH